MATAQRLSAESPISPTSCDTNFSGDTLPGDELNEDGPGPSNEALSENTSQAPTDLEAQNEKPRRPSLLQSMRKLSSSVTERIPDHWRPGHLNADRDKRQLDDYADGFPRFAAFMNCDDNFLMTRRYGWLHNRVMLFRQSKLRHLELELIDCDKDDEKDENESDALIDHKSFMTGENGEYRTELMEKIDGELERYDELVIRARAMSSLPKATVRNYTSICNQFRNRAPLAKREQDIFMNDSDFVALVEQEEYKAFDGFVEDLLTMLPCRNVTRFLFSSAEQRATTDDKGILLYDKRRIDTLVRLVITLLAVALLLAPVVVLFREQDSGTVKIVVILVFTLFFSLALSLATTARRAEVFAATSAYCAVLVVFLGNFIPTSGVST